MMNFLRNRPPSWRDYVDEEKTTVKGVVFKEGTPPEMIKQYERECEVYNNGLKI